MDPIQQQKRLVGEVAHAILYYGNVGKESPPETRFEAQQKLRDLSARLNATLRTIPKYRYFEARGWVEKRERERERENVSAATRNLVGWSNTVVMEDTSDIPSYQAEIVKALRLPL